MALATKNPAILKEVEGVLEKIFRGLQSMVIL
jgi:hypothetical protein